MRKEDAYTWDAAASFKAGVGKDIEQTKRGWQQEEDVPAQIHHACCCWAKEIKKLKGIPNQIAFTRCSFLSLLSAERMGIYPTAVPQAN